MSGSRHSTSVGCSLSWRRCRFQSEYSLLSDSTTHIPIWSPHTSGNPSLSKSSHLRRCMSQSHRRAYWETCRCTCRPCCLLRQLELPKSCCCMKCRSFRLCMWRSQWLQLCSSCKSCQRDTSLPHISDILPLCTDLACTLLCPNTSCTCRRLCNSPPHTSDSRQKYNRYNLPSYPNKLCTFLA